jgi:outer membrane protein assembly factor BamB
VSKLRATTLAFVAATVGLSLASVVGQEKPKPAAPAPPPPAPELLWRQTVAIPGVVRIAVAGPRIFLTSASAGLTVCSTEDGRTLWTAAEHSPLAPVALGTLVALVSEGVLHVWTQEDGARAWRADVDPAASLLFSFDDRLAVVSGFEVRTWRPTGTPDWRATLTGTPTTPFVFRNGLLFVGLDEPALVALDAATGAQKWRVPLRARPESLTATDDRLYLGATNATLYSYRTTGDPDAAWKFPRLPGAIGDPVTDDRHVYFALLDNSLRAFDLGGGAQRWSTGVGSRPVGGPMLLGANPVVALSTGYVVELSARGGQVRAPAKPITLPPARLQAAGLSSDGTSVFTVTIASDGSQTLTAWGRPRSAPTPSRVPWWRRQ